MTIFDAPDKGFGKPGGHDLSELLGTMAHMLSGDDAKTQVRLMEAQVALLDKIHQTLMGGAAPVGSATSTVAAIKDQLHVARKGWTPHKGDPLAGITRAEHVGAQAEGAATDPLAGVTTAKSLAGAAEEAAAGAKGAGGMMNLLGGFGGTALKSFFREAGPIGAVGLGWDIYNGATGEWAAQKKKNQWFQTATGAESFGSQMKQRVQDDIAGMFWGKGTYSGEETKQAIKQLNAMGYNDVSQNNGAAGFGGMHSAFNELMSGTNLTGLGANDELKIMGMERQSGGDIGGGFAGFNALNSAIKRLQKTAGEAGNDVSQMTSNLEQMIPQMQQLFGGTGGQNMSTAISQIAGGFGPSMSGQMTQTVASQQANSNYMTMAGALAGMTPGQMYQQQLQNPNAAIATAGLATKPMIDSVLQGQFGAEGYRAFIQMCHDMGGGDQSGTMIATNYLRMYPLASPQAFIKVLSQLMGTQFSDPVSALATVVGQYYMDKNSTKQAIDQAKQSSYVNTQGQAVGGKYGGQQVNNSGLGELQDMAKSNVADKALLGQAQSTGQYDNTLRAAIHQLGNDDQNQKWAIPTGSGMRIMTTAEAIQTGFGDAISSGMAKMWGGKNAGGDIASLGIGINAGALANEKAGGLSKQTQAGQSINDYNAKQQQDALGFSTSNGKSTTVGGVTIGLSAQAAKLLNIVDSSGTPADAAGQPRVNTVSNFRDQAGLLTNTNSSPFGGMSQQGSGFDNPSVSYPKQ